MEALLLWLGISAFATEVQARNKARAWPTLGRYLATLDLPEKSSVVIQRTNPMSRGHHTIWASPGELLHCVTRTTPV